MERWKEKEKDVINYWMTSMKGGNTGNLQRKHWITFSGEVASQETIDLSYGRLGNDDEEHNISIGIPRR